MFDGKRKNKRKEKSGESQKIAPELATHLRLVFSAAGGGKWFRGLLYS